MKTPADTANEILSRMIESIQENDFHTPAFIGGVEMDSKKYKKVLEEKTYDLAVECTLVAIRQIIQNSEFDVVVLSDTDPKSLGYVRAMDNLNYWDEVQSFLLESRKELQD